MSQKSKIKMSSNRSFGLVFFFVFLIISFWPVLYGEQVRVWSLLISIVFLILGLIKSKLLTPLNHLWLKFGKLLGSLVSPVIMGIIFFLVVTPTGFFMRIIGKDLLNKKYDKKKKSYWIKRDKYSSTMKQQF